MKIGKELDYLLSLQKRKDAKERILKVYNALLFKKGKSDYFQCPSSYLEKVNARYYKSIKLLIEHKIIDFQSINYDDTDLFNIRRKKYYNTEKGICARYKFIIDTEVGYDYDLKLDYSSLYEDEKWYMKTRYSLLQLGFKPDELLIKRDNFSRRLHTNVTGFIPYAKTYKELLSGGDYYSIDSKTSQPRLLWLKLKEIGLQDDKLNEIFENDLDFYDYIIQRIPAINDRSEAKELFASWLNGTGYLEEDKVSIRNIFPVANTFLRKFKTNSYKDVCKLLQYTEATIFIEHLLNNVPVDFCLSVHDSLIVKKEDVDLVLEWCRKERPELRFEKEEIKN
jgi:hypothetical protein